MGWWSLAKTRWLAGQKKNSTNGFHFYNVLSLMIINKLPKNSTTTGIVAEGHFHFGENLVFTNS